MSDTVKQIKDRLSIVDVVSQYVKLSRSGTALKARCPFHAERTPSFTVSAERGTYHCFGCGEGGDIFTFVEKIEGLDFKGALKVLADKAGVTIEYTHGGEGKEEEDERDRLYAAMEAATLYYQSSMTEEACTYLRERGLSDGTISAFRIGWAGNGWTDALEHLSKKKFTEAELLSAGLLREGDRGRTDKFRNRIMFPIADTAGRIVAFSGRTFGAHAHPDAPKYLNSPETSLYHKSRILYGFDRAKQAMRQLNCAILVEGQMDLIMSHQAGWANTVAVSGTAFTAEHAALVKRMTENLILALDADEAGMKATGKAAHASLALGLHVKVARILGGKDPADLILHDGPDAWKAAIRDAKDIVTFLLDVLEEKLPQPDRFRRIVEVSVIPFLADVPSPIERDAYVREISVRIGVSEDAVRETLARAPREPGSAMSQSVSAPTTPATAPGRAEKAYALLKWQRSLAAPTIDVAVFEHDLKEAIGEESFSQLGRGISDEHLRFEGEHFFTKTDPKKEVPQLLAVLERERLENELKEITIELKKAEHKEDEEGVAALNQRVRVLTSRIAQLHTKV